MAATTTDKSVMNVWLLCYGASILWLVPFLAILCKQFYCSDKYQLSRSSTLRMARRYRKHKSKSRSKSRSKRQEAKRKLKREEIDKNLRTMAIICILSYIFVSVPQLLLYGNLQFHGRTFYDEYNTFETSMMTIALFCFYLSKIALYSLYIYRLYISFNKTIYQSSLKVYYIFVIELIILFIAMCVITVCSAFSLVTSNIIVTILGFGVIECLDLIISFSVVLLFNDKLFQLIFSRKKSIHNESRDSSLVRIIKNDRNTKNKNTNKNKNTDNEKDNKNKQKNKDKDKKNNNNNNNIRTASMDETFHLNDTNATDSDVNYQSDTINNVNNNNNHNLGDPHRSKGITIDGKQIIILQPSIESSISNFNQSSENLSDFSSTPKERSVSSNSIIKFARSKADTLTLIQALYYRQSTQSELSISPFMTPSGFGALSSPNFSSTKMMSDADNDSNFLETTSTPLLNGIKEEEKDDGDDADIENDNDNENENESERERNKNQNKNQNKNKNKENRKKKKKRYYKMSLDELQLRYINTITRYTLLSGMSMIVSVTYFTSLLILRILWTLGETVDNNRYMLFTSEIFPIMHFMDVVVNSLCIFLNFRFGLEYYQSMCKHCHVTCKACCIKIAEKQIQKQIINEKHQEKQLIFDTQNQISDKKDIPVEKNDSYVRLANK